VFADVPGSDYLFAICSLVVLLSVVLHGGSLMLLGRIPAGGKRKEDTPPGVEDLEMAEVHKHDGTAPPAEPEPEKAQPVALTLMQRPPARPAPAELDGVEEDGYKGYEDRDSRAIRITLEEMRRLQEKGEKVIVLDARSVRTYDDSDFQAKGAVRLHPEQPAREAAIIGLPKDAWLVAFCA
jgi:hypothetical protein